MQDDNGIQDLRTLATILALYVCAWTVSHFISDANLDPYGDMLENVAWGQRFEWGNAKHPPLVGWVVGAWFSTMPRGDTAYHLLSYGTAAVGLLGIHRLGLVLGLGPRALPATLLMTLALPYSTLAVKFNANSILLAIWPWIGVAWCRCITRKSSIWALGLGVIAALGMLGKYYTATLLMTLVAATLATPAGRLWLRTPGPWLAAGAFLVSIAPHLNWLQNNDYGPIRYGADQGAGTINLPQLASFAAAPFIYWLLPWVIYAALTAEGSGRARLGSWFHQLFHAWRPTGTDDALFYLAVGPWLVSLVFGATGVVALSSPWAIPIGFAFPLLWARNLGPTRSLADVARRITLGWLAVILVLSPVYGWLQATDGDENHYRPRRAAANAALNEWRSRYPDEVLTWVAGIGPEATSIHFYGDPDVRPLLAPPDPASIDGAGMLFCALGPVDRPHHTDCPARMETWLIASGRAATPIRITVASEGWRFLQTRPFAYLLYPALP